jgi:hypothetical protein
MLVTESSSFSEYEFADILDIVADATLERPQWSFECKAQPGKITDKEMILLHQETWDLRKLSSPGLQSEYIRPLFMFCSILGVCG